MPYVCLSKVPESALKNLTIPKRPTSTSDNCSIRIRNRSQGFISL